MLASSLVAFLLASAALSAPLQRRQPDATTPDPNSPANVHDWVKYNKGAAYQVTSGAVDGVKSTAGNAKTDITDGFKQIGTGIRGTTAAVVGGVGAAVTGTAAAAKDKVIIAGATVAGKALGAKDATMDAVHKSGQWVKGTGE